MKRIIRAVFAIGYFAFLLSGCAALESDRGVKGHDKNRAAGRYGGSSQADISVRHLPQIGHYRASSLTGDYSNYSTLAGFIERMVEKHGYSREYLYGLFSQVHRKQWTIEYMNRQAPRSPASSSGGSSGRPAPGGWSRYRAQFLDEPHIGKGAAFWARNAETLKQASERYGVPPEYIMGIMGVETIFGANMGSHRVIDALTTLAFDYPRRADYFSSELESFLVMARREGLDPSQPVGSFAGAMGLGQFMPGSFLRWAVDFDGDGRRNLWDAEDAIGSIANYFASHGWRPAEPVVTPAVTSKAIIDSMEYGFDTHYSLASLTLAGVRPVQACPVEDIRLLRLSARSGTEYWLGHQNFYVLTRYNNSTHYAMAVHQLAQAIKERYKGIVVGSR